MAKMIITSILAGRKYKTAIVPTLFYSNSNLLQIQFSQAHRLIPKATWIASITTWTAFSAPPAIISLSLERFTNGFGAVLAGILRELSSAHMTCMSQIHHYTNIEDLYNIWGTERHRKLALLKGISQLFTSFSFTLYRTLNAYSSIHSPRGSLYHKT